MSEETRQLSTDAERAKTEEPKQNEAVQAGRRQIKIGSQRESERPMAAEPKPTDAAADVPTSADAEAMPTPTAEAPTSMDSDPMHASSPASGAAGEEALAEAESQVSSAPSPAPAGQETGPPPGLEGPTPDLEQEIDAAMADISLDELLQEPGEEKGASGELPLDTRCRGTVVKVYRDAVFFALGGQHEGIASIKHFEQPPEPGSQWDVVPTRFLSDEGLYELVIPGASIQVGDWSDLTEGVVVEVRVTGHNSGGLECEVNHIRGFIPLSQVALYRVEDPESYVGQKLPCVVTEANPQRRNLVLSHRAVLEREKQEARERTLQELEVGQVREGTVRSIRDFGAFVDLGGVDGLVHVSQLSWDRIAHPREVLEEGQRIKVRVEKIDSASGRIGLSYRDLLDNPWDDIDTKFPVGSIQKGVVSKIMEFGAFVKLAAGVEGLVHISELAHHRVVRVANVVQEGNEVDVRVLSVDRDAQRISLSIKQAQAMQASEAEGEEEQETETTPPPQPRRTEPLKGGLNRPSGGDKFGLKW